MFSVPVVPSPLVKVPTPVSAVVIVSVPLLVIVPVIATLGMDIVPPMVLAAPEKVCVPVLALYVPLLVRFPAMPTTAAPFSVNVPLIVTSEPNERAAATLSVRVAPLLIVTAPVNVLAPVLASVKVPETDVVPPTVKVHVLVAPVANVAPALIVSGTFVPKVFAVFVVIVPIPPMITPPVPLNVAGHSKPVVNGAVLLYCRVAAVP